MSKVNIQNISIRGFGSIVKQISFDLNRRGLWFIKGSNGTGKTSLFSALSWCLYKVNLKGLNNDQIVTWEWLRDDKWKGTRVAVVLDTDDFEYMIVRHIKYKGQTLGLDGGNSLMIFRKPENEDRDFEQSDLVGEAQHKGDQQAYINKLLGLDAQAFLSSILFGQRMRRLIESDNSDKRKLFETLFDLDFIAEVKNRASTKLNEEVSAEKGIVEANLNSAKQSVNSLKYNINWAVSKNETIKINAENRRKKLLEEIQNKDEKLKELLVKLPELEKVASKYNSNIETVFSSDVEEVQKKWLELKESLSNKKVSFRDEVVKKYADLEKEIEELISGCKERKRESLKLLDADLEAIEANIKVAKNQFESASDAVLNSNNRLGKIDGEYAQVLAEIERLGGDILKVPVNCPTCEQVLLADKYDKVVANIREQIKKEGQAKDVLEEQKEIELVNNKKLVAVKDEKKEKLESLKKQLEEKGIEWKTTNNDDFGLSALLDRQSELKNKKEADLDIDNDSEIIKLTNLTVAAKQDYDNKVLELDKLKLDNAVYKKAVDELLELRSLITIAEASLEMSKKAKEEFESTPLELWDTKKMQLECENGEKEIKELSAKFSDLALYEKRIQWWVTKGFGSGGIKAFVFSAMLAELNNQMEKYSSRLGLMVRFFIDLSKASKPFVTEVLKDGNQVDYEELSGGEKSRVDTVMAFGVHDVISRNTNINLLIMDEFSSGLDAEGYSVFMDLIRLKTKDKTVYLVEHNENVDVSEAKFIEAVKENGSTIFV